MGRPENVRIVRPDGSEVPCQLIHEGYDAERDMDEWRITGTVFRPGLDVLKVGVFPARTGLAFDAKFVEVNERYL